MLTTEQKLATARKNFAYDENQVMAGIRSAEKKEQNSSPRYSPFLLSAKTPELTAAIQRDRKNRTDL